MKRFAVLESPLSIDEVMHAVQGPEIGGIALFIGTVRDQNAGQPITLLEYQAYAAMAEKEMQRIAEQIEREQPGTRLAVHHRTGALGIGDLAVVCAAGAAHRDAAFSACRALIDRIKQSVPIWKREHGPAGPYWIGWEDQGKVPGA